MTVVELGRQRVVAAAAKNRALVRLLRRRLAANLLVRRQRLATKQRIRELRTDAGATKRLEFGSGRYPTPGYVHIDTDPQAPDLDILAPAHAVTLPDGWAEEIRAVHVLEHIPPGHLQATLAAWHDLLRPDGLLDIHVPNGAALARAMLNSEEQFDRSTAWRANAAIYGYTIDPVTQGDEILSLRGDAEHRLLFTFPMLSELLREAGFNAIVAAQDDNCRHNGPWEAHVPSVCLRVTARR